MPSRRFAISAIAAVTWRNLSATSPARSLRPAEEPKSAKLIDEAQGLARGLKNDALLAAVSKDQGDAFFYQGDLKSANGSYEQAARLASHTADKDALLTARMNFGESRWPMDVRELQSAYLRTLAQQADAQGRRYISVASSVLLAEAMIKNKDYANARQELQRSLGKSEKLGLRLENARIHYLLGAAMRLSGNASEATAQYREAGRLLEEIGKEPGAEHISERYDLKPIYAEAKQFAQ